MIGLLMACTALAQTGPNDRFDVGRLNAADKRILQAALAFEGFYNGVLDGAWGKGSQSALVAMTRKTHNRKVPNWSHVENLLTRLDNETRTRGWALYSPQFSPVSVLVPLGSLSKQSARREESLRTEGNDLQIRFVPQNIAQALMLANTVSKRHSGRGRPYQSLREDRLIVTAELENGGGVYLRTAKSGDRLTSVIVEWAPSQEKAAKLVIASIRNGPQAGLELPRDGFLRRLRPTTEPQLRRDWTPRTPEANTDFWPRTTPEPSARPDPFGPMQGRMIGAAFYINNTDLVTAASPLAGCRRLVLENGQRLQVLVRDDRRNLALLTSDQRSRDWLSVNPVYPGRGDQLYVIGFATGELAVDVVPVRRRAHDSAQAGKLLLERAARTGTLGAPMLTEDRRLAGISIRHPDNRAQNRMTFAASAELLDAFLTEHRIAHTENTAAASPDRVKDTLTSAVRRLRCAG